MTPEQFEVVKKSEVLKPLNNAEELQSWMTVYLGITFPSGYVYPTSTHGPIEAMWRIYELMKTGDSQHVPQITMLASRDSFKTLSAAAIEVLCMLHFRISVAHMAAIKSQSEKAIEYVNSFFRKLHPYLEHQGWRKISDNKSRVEWLTETGQNVYLRIVIATIAGANSEHVPMLFIDEVDVVQDPRALKEAKMIPSVFGGYFPLTVYLSTRKFAGGLMEKTLKETIAAGGEILRWNIVDVCERITLEQAQADLPRVERYVSRDLPMENLSAEEFNKLAEEKRPKYEKIMAYAGIAEHQLLSVMRNYLVDRPQGDTGDLYKPLISVHNNFKQTAPDWAEAQLLCNKPSSVGLVYPRFDDVDNVLSVKEAITRLIGSEPEVATFEYLKQYILSLGIPIIGGADWGFSDYTSMNVLALIPNGDIWYMTNHTSDNMEIDDIVKIGKELQRAWNVQKWYCDQNYPAYLKTLRKNGLKCPKFTKVVEDGIAAVQSKIIDSDNRRRFYIIDVPENKFVINAFSEYRWKTDGKGEIVEGKPEHGTDGTSDVLDAIRYPFQNMYARGAKPMIAMEDANGGKIVIPKSTPNNLKEISEEVNKQLMKNQIKSLTGGQSSPTKKSKSGKNGKIHWKL